MDEIKLYLQRSENELVMAEALYRLSFDTNAKEFFDIEDKFTFYNGVIAHSYYSIFYCAKALLLKENVKTKAPQVHKKTLQQFEKVLVKTGKLDFKLLHIYKKIIVKADELLSIFSEERSKRGAFKYQKLPHANKEPAKDSLNNALKFFKNTNVLV